MATIDEIRKMEREGKREGDILTELRNRGVPEREIVDAMSQSQIKDAVKRDIPLFIAYGVDEVANNIVRMKILATGEESVLPMSELPVRLRSGS